MSSEDGAAGLRERLEVALAAGHMVPLEWDLRDDRWADMIHPIDRARVLAEMLRWRDDPPHDAQFMHRAISEGGVRWVEVHGRFELEGDKPVRLVGVERDVTAQHIAEQRTAELQAATAALSEAATAVEVARVAVEHARYALDASAGAVLARGRGERTLEIVHSEGMGGPQLERYSPMTLDDGLPVCDAVNNGIAVFLSDRDELVRRYPHLAETVPEEAWAALPLAVEGVTIGALALSFSSGRAFATADRAFLAVLAQLTAAALDRARRSELPIRAREELMAIVAHDLRNPLGSIMTSAALLQGLDVAPPAGDKLRRYANIISRSADRMSRWITDLLDLTVLDGGRMRLERTSHDAATIVRDACELFAPVAADKKLRLESVVVRVEPVNCDRERIHQVLANLIGNAIKFTPEGGRIAVGIDGDGEARFSVTDDGPGIADEVRTKIFERYWQARPRKATGVGLGLAIAKGLVEAHGGKIWVESGNPSGTTFYFTVPA